MEVISQFQAPLALSAG